MKVEDAKNLIRMREMVFHVPNELRAKFGSLTPPDERAVTKRALPD